MTGQGPVPGAGDPAIDSGGLEDAVAGVEDLPDDVPNDDLTAQQPPVVVGIVPDTDVDLPVGGTPLTDAEIDD
jgi:hypothetical protein